ncbi:MAG: hypothetical protein H0T42_33185 [Deltaproteobacteria bacterium]|nr:hypothetical protein [Deltaproteobacteria bacterium]
MKLPRSIGLVDIAIITVVLVMIVLPARRMYASAAHKGDEAARFGLALSEARTMAQPNDGMHAADLGRRLGDAEFKDWAIEVAADGAVRARGTPSEWRALLAASIAYVDRLDVVAALDHANRALASCQAMQGGCPSWEEVRMQLYQQHLDAGVSSGIDPRHDPKGFRTAGEGAVRTIRLNTQDRESGPGNRAP